MKIELEWTAQLRDVVHGDLSRPHPFAAERVGFLSVRKAGSRDFTLQAQQWHPIADEDYIRRPRVGACIGPAAFRKILQHAHFNDVGLLHVHRHEHRGKPTFSVIDRRSMTEFIPSCFNAQPRAVHGAMVLSYDSACAMVRLNSHGSDLPVSILNVL